MLSSEVRDISALDEEDGDICWRDCVAPYDNDVPPPRELDPVRRELVRPLEIVVSVTNGPLQFHTAPPNHHTPERLSSSLEYSLSYCLFVFFKFYGYRRKTLITVYCCISLFCENI